MPSAAEGKHLNKVPSTLSHVRYKKRKKERKKGVKGNNYPPKKKWGGGANTHQQLVKALA